MTRKQLEAMIKSLDEDFQRFDKLVQLYNTGRNPWNAQAAEILRSMTAVQRDAYKAALAVTD